MSFFCFFSYMHEKLKERDQETLTKFKSVIKKDKIY